jgi:hypothetical protein
MTSAFDVNLVKAVKRDIAESNHSMELLKIEIEDVLKIESTPSFKTARGIVTLVQGTETKGRNTGTWKLIAVPQNTISQKRKVQLRGKRVREI